MRIRGLLLLGLGLLLLLPPLTFVLCGVAEGMRWSAALAAMTAQFAADAKPNLLATSVLGLLPLAVYGGVLWLIRRLGRRPALTTPIGLSGLASLAAVIVWCNAVAWTSFLPARSMPGWPHGLELVIGPLFFAPPAMHYGSVE